MTRYAMLGEIMLRLKSPGHERLFQSPMLETSMAGAEANVAVGLSCLGEDASFITVLPENDLGRNVISELRRHGVDTSRISMVPGRLGLYFVEAGSNHRPARVIYDRADSCMAGAEPGTFDWKELFADRDWFHTSGITPAISETAMQLTLEAMKTARHMGLTVSCDLNFRAALWQYGHPHVEVYRKMMEYVDVLIANEGHYQSCLGLTRRVNESDITENPENYRQLVDEVFQTWPGVKRIATTVRRTFSADHQAIAAVLATGNDMWVSPIFDIENIVDRIGGGDALTAGLFHGLNRTGDSLETITFAAAASALKHSIPGDFLRASLDEIQALALGAKGRDQR
ncbi:sugar kinase [Desulfospira joergensenii]|uniref:sugar kinase n=1 Tax=Desulfospira joergensenii TaxID=53329 RepID=UPI0003B49004|nr:sugar kinase [Desulfospira joergensenii]